MVALLILINDSYCILNSRYYLNQSYNDGRSCKTNYQFFLGLIKRSADYVYRFCIHIFLP